MLPTQKTPPKPNLHDLTVLVYGPHKFGKSEFCSRADNAVFLATEPGQNHLEVYQQPIRTWDELLVAAKDIAEGKHAFRTVIIDTVDNAYRMCAEYICQKNKIEHESDLEYGKGYSLVNGEFHRVLNKLALLPYGLFLVSHSQERDIETRTGKYTKVVPTLPDKARKLVLGLVDIILFCDLEPATAPDGKPIYRRVLRTKPSAGYEAGDRTRRLPEVIDLDFAAFVAAFAQGAARAAAATTAPASAPVASSEPGTSMVQTAAPATSAPAAPTTALAHSPPTSTTAAVPAEATTAAPAKAPTTSSPIRSTSSVANSARPAPTAPSTRHDDAHTAAPSRPRAMSAASSTRATNSARASTAASSPTSTTAASRQRMTSAASR